MWLAQSDNLHLIQWFGKSGSETEVSAYFTPEKWWQLGANTIIVEQQQVYLNVLDAMEPYLPARIIRRAKQQDSIKANRRKRAQEEPGLNYMARYK
jgi:alpha-amylase